MVESIKEAIKFHIESLTKNGETIPKPHCDIVQVEVDAA